MKKLNPFRRAIEVWNEKTKKARRIHECKKCIRRYKSKVGKKQYNELCKNGKLPKEIYEAEEIIVKDIIERMEKHYFCI